MPKISQGFKFFAHPADAKFQAYGGNLEEAFQNAAYALVSLMWDRDRVRPEMSYPVALEARDLKQLLVSFLEEVLYLLDSRGFLLHSVDELTIVKEGHRFLLRSRFGGDRCAEGLETFGEVKAITYHEMVIETDGRAMVQVVVDV